LQFLWRDGKRFSVFSNGRIAVGGALQRLAAEIVTDPIGWVELLGAL